jgi:hypothetical protein
MSFEGRWLNSLLLYENNKLKPGENAEEKFHNAENSGITGKETEQGERNEIAEPGTEYGSSESEKQLPDTLSPEEKRGSIEGGSGNAETTVITGRMHSANKAAKRGG